MNATAEIDDLTRALIAGSEWCYESEETDWLYRTRETDAAFAEQLIRDNAVRLLATLEVAAPFLRRPDRPRVLECGAGSLYTVEALRWRYGDALDLHAVEHPDAAGGAVRAECAKRSVTFATCDLLEDEPPWPGRDFDLIILAEVIEHIPSTQLPDMLRRIAARVRPGGALLLTSPNSQAISNVLSLAIGKGQMLDPAFPPEHGFYGHIRMYSRTEIEGLLEYAGLRPAAWRTSNWMHAHPHPGASLSDRIRLGIQRYVGAVVPPWASGWICAGVPR